MKYTRKNTRKNTKKGNGGTRNQIGDKINGNSIVNQKSFDMLVKRMLEIITLLRLYHWNTYSYATHKATGDLYDGLSDKADNYVETMIGKSNGKYRIRMSNYNKLTIKGVSNNTDMVNTIKSFIKELDSFHLRLSQSFYSDIINIKDEIVGDLNKYLYLLTLK
jgi:DNA-binding ferritin-like protein